LCGSATGEGSFPGYLLLTHEYGILTKELAYCHNWLFVFLWSTGFVAAKFTVQFSGPFHLLFFRGAFSCLIFLLIALAFRSRFPSRAGIVRNLIVGLFLQSFFLGGCFYAIHRGMPAGIVALITGL